MLAMDRRDFIRQSLLAAGAALARPAILTAAAEAALRLTVKPDRLGNRIAADFTGLSYESAQLGNPDFFSAGNTELVGFLRTLGSQGVLRIGGNTSEFCYWSPDGAAPAGPRTTAALEAKDKATPIGRSFVVGSDAGHKAPPASAITPLAIRNLREFLDATGWKLIYGLNLGTGTPEVAAEEAAYVSDRMGSKLLAFQLGNEPDLFSRNGLRNPDYGFDQFAQDWQRFHDAILARVPHSPFAGPDTAYNDQWLVPFAKRWRQAVLYLSQHYYAEGPPTDPAMTIERLLRPNPKLINELAGMRDTVAQTGLPFRMAETNSCYQGGKPGVSDTFASALWGSDLMYQLASAGGIGINFHGGGYGWYSPIAGTRQNGFLARPLYYGMLMFAQAGAGTLLETTLDQAPEAPLLTAYALRAPGGALKVAAFNKNGDRAVELDIDPGLRTGPATALRLYAPRLDDATDVTLAGAPVGAHGSWSVASEEKLAVESGIVRMELPPASAALVTFAIA
jgi:Glycosyl hydrolase family 79, N-terminal domain